MTPARPIEQILQGYLRTEFLRRSRLNSRYSLRAFARALDVDPASLSQMLRSRRVVSRRFAERIARRGGKLGSDLAELLASVPSDGVSPVNGRRETSLSVDAFELISDWYHMAIYELVTIEGFRREPRWIAKKLSIPVADAREAIERLFRLEFLAVDGETGAWIQRAGLLTTTATPFTAYAFRVWQHQALDLAKEAMESTPIGERDQSTMLFAIDRRSMPELKARIKRFRRSLHRFCEAADAKDAVYQLTTAFYPVTDRRAPTRILKTGEWK